jgi:hypothetical protein
MINRHPSTKSKSQSRVVIRIAGANYELRGASECDLTAAKEWVSLFLHEACVDLAQPPIPHRRATSNSRWKVSSLGKSA